MPVVGKTLDHPNRLALFVQKRVAAGDKRAEIARRLGKSRQYLTLATALIEAPDWLLDAYRQGRCRGLAELYELRRLHGDHPRQVQAWVATTGSITRDRVAILKNDLSGQDGRIDEIPTSTGENAPGQEDAETAERSIRPAATAVAPRRHLNRRVHVEFEGQDYQLVLSVAPPREGTMYVRPLSGGPRRAAPASALKLRGFVDR